MSHLYFSGCDTQIFKISPNVKIIWAHAGFDTPDVVSRMMDTHKNLWADLSLREFGTLDDAGIADADLMSRQAVVEVDEAQDGLDALSELGPRGW